MGSHAPAKTDRGYWSKDDHAMLKRMAAAGAYAREIANAVGRTRNAVIGRAWRKGVVLLNDHRE